MKRTALLLYVILALTVSVELSATPNNNSVKLSNTKILMIMDTEFNQPALFKDAVNELTNDIYPFSIVPVIDSRLFSSGETTIGTEIFDDMLSIERSQIDMIVLFKDRDILPGIKQIRSVFPDIPIILTGLAGIGSNELEQIDDPALYIYFLPNAARTTLRFIAYSLPKFTDIYILYDSQHFDAFDIEESKAEIQSFKRHFDKIQYLDIRNQLLVNDLRALNRKNVAIYVMEECFNVLMKDHTYKELTDFLLSDRSATFAPEFVATTCKLLSKCVISEIDMIEELSKIIEQNADPGFLKGVVLDTSKHFTFMMNKDRAKYFGINQSKLPPNVILKNNTTTTEKAFYIVIGLLVLCLYIIIHLLVMRSKKHSAYRKAGMETKDQNFIIPIHGPISSLHEKMFTGHDVALIVNEAIINFNQVVSEKSKIYFLILSSDGSYMQKFIFSENGVNKSIITDGRYLLVMERLSRVTPMGHYDFLEEKFALNIESNLLFIPIKLHRYKVFALVIESPSQEKVEFKNNPQAQLALGSIINSVTQYFLQQFYIESVAQQNLVLHLTNSVVWIYDFNLEKFHYLGRDTIKPMLSSDMQKYPLPTTFADLPITDKDRATLKDKLAALKNRTKDSLIHEVAITAKNETKYFEIWCRITEWDEQGSPCIMSGITKDINEKKMYRETMMTYKAQYESFFLNSEISMLIIDGYKISDCNKQAMKMFKANRNDLVGLSANDLSPEYQEGQRLSIQAVEDLVQETLQNGTSTYRDWHTKDILGEIFYTDIFLKTYYVKNKEYLLLTLVDTTEEFKQLQHNIQLRKMLMAVSNNMGVLIISTDKSYRLTYINQVLLDKFDCAAEEFENKNAFSELFQSKLTNNTLFDKLETLVSSNISDIGRHEHEICTYIDFKGNEVLYDWSLMIEKNTNGTIEQIHAFGIELPNSYRAESPKKTNHIKIQQILDTYPEPVLIIDENQHILFANTSILKIMELDRQNILGTDLSAYIDDSNLSAIELNDGLNDAFDDLLQEGVHIEPKNAVIRLSAGRRLNVTIAAQPILNSSQKTIGGLVHISPQNETDIELLGIKHVNERFKSIVDTIASVLLVLSTDLEVKYINPYGEKIFGYSFDELVGCDIFETLMAEQTDTALAKQRVLKYLEEHYFNTGQHYSISNKNLINQNITKDGQLYWFAWTMAVDYDEQGQPYEIYAIGTNISKYREQLLSQENSNIYNDQFSNVLKHAIFALRQDQTIEHANAVALQMLGLSHSEVLNMPYDKIFLKQIPECDENILNHIESMLTAKRTLNNATPLLINSADGQKVFELSAIMLRDKSNKGGVVIIFNDITERKAIEKDLLDSITRQHAVIDSIDDQVMISYYGEYPDDYNVAYNNALKAGLRKSDITLQKDIIHQEDYPQIEEAKALIQNTDIHTVHYEYRIKYAPNKWQYQSAIEKKVKDPQTGEKIALVTIIRDVTEIKESQEQLEKTKRSLEAYSQNLESIVEQRTLELVERNQKLEEIYLDLTRTQSSLVQSERLAALGKLIAGVAHEINSPLGSIMSCLGSAKDAQQNIIKQMSILYDKLGHDEIILYQQLLERALQAKETMLSTIQKRDIRNHLKQKLEPYTKDTNDANFIINTLMNLDLYENIEDYLPLIKNSKSSNIFESVNSVALLSKSHDTIEIASLRASQVIVALRNYVHTSSGNHAQKIDVREGLDVVLALYHSKIKHDVLLEKEYALDLPQIYAFPEAMNQIWTNMIDNALHAMNYSGKLTIKILNEDNEIIVMIKDTGYGIAEENLPKIFDPYFTTKDSGQGTGLGLDITEKIVDAHGGRIDVISVLKQGTTFIVHLPINNGLHETSVYPNIFIDNN